VIITKDVQRRLAEFLSGLKARTYRAQQGVDQLEQPVVDHVSETSGGVVHGPGTIEFYLAVEPRGTNGGDQPDSLQKDSRSEESR
jgi:hypothetical protein